MLFADLVTAVRRVDAAPRRSDQVDVLAGLFEAAGDDARRIVAWIDGERRADLDDFRDHELPAAPAASPSIACLTVADVDRLLSAPPGGGPDGDDAAAALSELRSRATADEWEMLGEYFDRRDGMGIDEGVVISAIAKVARVRVGDVQRAATIVGSLAAAAEAALCDGVAGLDAIELTPGRPIAPMRAVVVPDAAHAIADIDDLVVEWQLSGQRVHAHRTAGVVRVFDDELTDVTADHATVVRVVGRLPGGDLILDGVTEGVSVQFFDALFIDVPLTDAPLRDRRRRLVELLPKGALVRSFAASDVVSVERLIDAAGRRGRRGIVVKDLSSSYEPGRRSAAWRRLAFAYTFDAVVLAAEWGAGRRAGYLSRVHVGARDEDGSFRTIARTARGLSDEMLAWQTERFIELALDPVPESPSGVVRVRPVQVVELAALGVSRSAENDSGYALDDASIRRYRHDVGVEAVTDVAAVATVAGMVEETASDSSPSDDAPRLPTLPPTAPPPGDPPVGDEPGAGGGDEDARRSRPEALTATTVSASSHPRNADFNIDFDFPPYQPPILDRSRIPHRSVLIARVAVWLWVLVLAGATIASRLVSDGDELDGSKVEAVGRFAPVVVTGLVLTGWWWTDQRTRNLLKLDGRRPGRLRNVTAWLSPIVGAAIILYAVLPLEPTELLDLRPFIITLLFPLFVWRPYSLVRRIFATLIRLRFDALIAVAYLLDVVSFGLIWWWLGVWPSDAEPAARNEIDVLVGIGLAVCLTTAISAVVWFMLIRAGDAAEGHREVSQRTRYEHRMLRLRGADPTEPAVWWALVQRRAEEQHEIEASTAGSGVSSTLARRDVPNVDALLANVRVRNGVALRRLGADGSNELLRRIRAQFAAVTGERVDGAGPATDRSTDPTDAGDTELAPPPFDAAHADVGGGLPALPTRKERLRQQFGVDVAPASEVSPMERLLDHAGSVQVEAAIAEQNRRLAGDRSDERMLPPTLYPIEAVRLLLLAALAAAAVAGLWLVTQTLSAGSDTVASVADRAADIEQARGFVIAITSVALALIPLWTYVAAAYAERCGVEDVKRRRHIVLFVISASANVASFVVDGTDRDMASSVLLVLVAACASTAGLWSIRLRVWFGLRSITVFVWATVLPLVVAALWLGGLHEPTVAVDELETMTLGAVLAAVGLAMVLVLMALSTDDYHDELRLSPELQVPASSRRRRRRRR